MSPNNTKAEVWQIWGSAKRMALVMFLSNRKTCL